MTLYIIMNDDPAKRTAKELDRIDAPTPQAAAAGYWNKHADYWQGRVQAAESGMPQEEIDYTRKKRQQWAEDRARRKLWVGTGEPGSFREI